MNCDTYPFDTADTYCRTLIDFIYLALKPPPVATTNPLKEFEEVIIYPIITQLIVQHALIQIRSVQF